MTRKFEFSFESLLRLKTQQKKQLERQLAANAIERDRRARIVQELVSERQQAAGADRDSPVTAIHAYEASATYHHRLTNRIELAQLEHQQAINKWRKTLQEYTELTRALDSLVRWREEQLLAHRRSESRQQEANAEDSFLRQLHRH